MPMTFTHALLALSVMAVWGFNFVAGKVAVGALPPILVMALRFACAGLLLAPFVRWPRRGQWRQIAGAAFTLGGVHFSLMFTGLKGLDASTTAIASQTSVPFAALLAAIFLNEKLGWQRAIGMAIAFSGIVLIAGEPRLGHNLFPFGLVLAGSFVWAVATIQIKGFRQPVDGRTLTAWISLLAVPQLLLASALLEDGQVAALRAAGGWAWAAVLYMAVAVTIIGYGIWYYLLSRYPINLMMAFTLLVPLFGVLSGVVVLGDPLTWPLAIGGALTIVGIAVIILRRPRLVATPARGRGL